ncbi:unnamed protein product [Brassica oleracea var. botrytis]
MKKFKTMCRYTKSGFIKSSPTPQIGMSERVFSATPKSENQQPPPADEDIVDDDLVSPFIYHSNLGYSRNPSRRRPKKKMLMAMTPRRVKKRKATPMTFLQTMATTTTDKAGTHNQSLSDAVLSISQFTLA